MGVIVTRKVVLKAVVTPEMRDDVLAELDANLVQLGQQMEQFDREASRQLFQMQTTNLEQAMQFKQQIEAAKQQQGEQVAELQRRREIVANWADGQEVLRGAMEGFVEIEVGDHLPTVLGGVEIIAKDDMVVGIRETNPMEDEDDGGVVEVDNGELVPRPELEGEA